MPTYHYYNDTNFSFEVTPETSEITRYTFYPDGNLWEQDSMKYFYNMVPKDKEVNIIDVGAQSGLYTLYAKFLPNSTFYSFEPFKKTYDLLNENIKLNNLQNVHTFNLGLSNEKGEIILNTSASHNGLHTCGNNPLRFSDVIPISIEVDKIDNLFYDKGIPVHFIKIDTEGWEINVLRGGLKTIKKYKPYIQLEWNETNMRQCNISESELNNLIVNEMGYVRENLINEELFIKSRE